MLIDCDIHISPPGGLPELLDYMDAGTRELVRNSGSTGLELPNYPWYHPTGWGRKDVYDPLSEDAELHGGTLEQLREMALDKHGVSYGIATPDGIGGSLQVLPNPYLAARLARAHNEWLLDAYLSREPRLRGLVAVSPQYPEEAAKEIRRIGARDEFVGVFLAGGARIPYGNPVYDPIWAAATELGLPVVVHTHYEGVGIAGPVTAAGYPDFYVEYHTLSGSGMYGHLVSILCHGVFERFPGAKLLMVEGGILPFIGFLWRLDANWKGCRSEVPWVRRPPSEYVWDHVRFTSQPLESPPDPALLVPAIQGLRPWDTLCFASDYPHWDYDEPVQTLNRLPSDWRDAVSWRNAADFFALPVPAAATERTISMNAPSAGPTG